MELFAIGSILVSVLVMALCFQKGEPSSIGGFIYTIVVLYLVPLFVFGIGFELDGFGPYGVYLMAISVSILLASLFRPYRIVNYVDAQSQKRVMWKMYMGDTAEYAEWQSELKAHRKYFFIMLGLLPLMWALSGMLASELV